MSNSRRSREHKSNSFALLLREKKYALEVYNALNETDYEDPELVEVLDVEEIFKLSVRGDSEFLLQNMLNFYEHQSSVNLNMPLRFLIYAADLYRVLLDKANIFGRKLIKIPNPKFVVFYNGDEKIPERVEYKLSDSFINEEDNHFLELKCLCININPGYNKKIKEKSSALAGYMEYVEKVKNNCKTMDLRQSVIRAVDECISEGILKEFFMANRRIIISRDPIDGTIERQKWFAREEGREEGREAERAEMIENALRKGKSPEAIADFIDISIDQVFEVQKSMELTPNGSHVDH